MKLFPKELSLKQSPTIMREGGLQESHSAELTVENLSKMQSLISL